MKYKIVKAWSHDYLEKRVDYMLERGWQIQGGVSVTVIKHGVQYAQAVVRDENTMINQEDLQEFIAPSIKRLAAFLDENYK